MHITKPNKPSSSGCCNTIFKKGEHDSLQRDLNKTMSGKVSPPLVPNTPIACEKKYPSVKFRLHRVFEFRMSFYNDIFMLAAIHQKLPIEWMLFCQKKKKRCWITLEGIKFLNIYRGKKRSEGNLQQCLIYMDVPFQGFHLGWKAA